MVYGSGSEGGLPAIYVSYPIGAICTCTNGTKTFTAKDTTGFWLFGGLEIGTWTLTISDPTGTQTDRSTTVTISNEVEVVNVTLSYELYLYRAGNECIDVTGGWQARGVATYPGYSPLAPTLTKNSAYMAIAYSGTVDAQSGVVEVVNNIDLSNYEYLYVDLDSTGSPSGIYYNIFVVKRDAAYYQNSYAATLQCDNNTSRVTYTLPIQELSGDYNIAISPRLTTPGGKFLSLDINVYNVWME